MPAPGFDQGHAPGAPCDQGTEGGFSHARLTWTPRTRLPGIRSSRAIPWRRMEPDPAV